jgi:hypothetical protein
VFRTISSKKMPQRPSTANPKASDRSGVKARPHTARPATSEGKESILQEIQRKLKAADFAPVLTNPVLDHNLCAGKKPLLGLLDEKLPPPIKSTAHKRFQSVNPCSSKLLAKKWDDSTWHKHKEKIKTMKACIDNVHSDRPSSLKSNKKSIATQGFFIIK